MIKAVFFDLDGVLLQTNYKQAVREFEVQHDITEGQLFVSVHGRPYWKQFTRGYITEKEYLQRVADDFSGELDTQQFKQHLRMAIEPIQGSFALAKKIRQQCQTGIITNFPKEWYEWSAAQFDFPNFFDVAAVSGLMHIRKPDKGIFEYALQQTKTKPAESVYIDDRPERVDGARELGIHLLLFKDAGQVEKNLQSLLTQEAVKQ